VEDLKSDAPLTEVYLAALSFLAQSREAGIDYRQGTVHHLRRDECSGICSWPDAVLILRLRKSQVKGSISVK
jgi:hypothetical protein